MKFKRDMTWWYWLATAILMLGALMGCEHSFAAAVALVAAQAIHFAIRTRRVTSFPVQMRVVYLGLMLLGTVPYMGWLHALMTVGTSVSIIFHYCMLSRTLSLLPWNRSEAMSPDLLKRTYLAKPVYGVVQHGLGDMFVSPYPYMNLAQRPTTDNHATATVVA